MLLVLQIYIFINVFGFTLNRSWRLFLRKNRWPSTLFLHFDVVIHTFVAVFAFQVWLILFLVAIGLSIL